MKKLMAILVMAGMLLMTVPCSAETGRNVSVPSPFYGIWITASKDITDVQNVVTEARNRGLNAGLYITTDWSNLNPEFWYVASAGEYASEASANAALPNIQAAGYGDAYVKYTGNWKSGGNAGTTRNVSVPSPFYGIWITASKDITDVQNVVTEARNRGLNAGLYITTDWSNLNPEFWYVASAGEYASEASANAALPNIQAAGYWDAYVKYTGNWQSGGNTGTKRNVSVPSPFYGIWITASKDITDVQNVVTEARNRGLNAGLYITTDWSNLNPEFWYVASAGEYASEASANAALPNIQAAGYGDAYVKYTGSWQG